MAPDTEGKYEIEVELYDGGCNTDTHRSLLESFQVHCLICRAMKTSRAVSQMNRDETHLLGPAAPDKLPPTMPKPMRSPLTNVCHKTVAAVRLPSCRAGRVPSRYRLRQFPIAIECQPLCCVDTNLVQFLCFASSMIRCFQDRPPGPRTALARGCLINR